LSRPGRRRRSPAGAGVRAAAVTRTLEAAVAPPTTRHDPWSGCHFRVEIDGIQSTEFLACSGLSSESDVIEYREGGETTVRKLPGLTRYGRIVLKRGMTANRELWDWRQTVVNGQTERRNGVIVLLDDARIEVLRWRFVNGWPA